MPIKKATGAIINEARIIFKVKLNVIIAFIASDTKNRYKIINIDKMIIIWKNEVFLLFLILIFWDTKLPMLENKSIENITVETE